MTRVFGEISPSLSWKIIPKEGQAPREAVEETAKGLTFGHDDLQRQVLEEILKHSQGGTNLEQAERLIKELQTKITTTIGPGPIDAKKMRELERIAITAWLNSEK